MKNIMIFLYKEYNNCVICIESMNAHHYCVECSKCKNMFHKDCIEMWYIKGGDRCPICRTYTYYEEKEVAQFYGIFLILILFVNGCIQLFLILSFERCLIRNS